MLTNGSAFAISALAFVFAMLALWIHSWHYNGQLKQQGDSAGLLVIWPCHRKPYDDGADPICPTVVYM